MGCQPPLFHFAVNAKLVIPVKQKLGLGGEVGGGDGIHAPPELQLTIPQPTDPDRPSTNRIVPQAAVLVHWQWRGVGAGGGGGGYANRSPDMQCKLCKIMQK